MPPAARLADLTSHGTPLGPGPGSPNVLIGGMPAWRAEADLHVCPLLTVLVPHVGGVVALGSLTVLIGGLPAQCDCDGFTECIDRRIRSNDGDCISSKSVSRCRVGLPAVRCRRRLDR